jgi:hypothetical protein
MFTAFSASLNQAPSIASAPLISQTLIFWYLPFCEKRQLAIAGRKIALTTSRSLLYASLNSTAKVQDLMAPELCWVVLNASWNSQYPGQFSSSASSHSILLFLVSFHAS